MPCLVVNVYNGECRLEDGIFITGHGERNYPFPVPGFLCGVCASGRRYITTRGGRRSIHLFPKTNIRLNMWVYVVMQFSRTKLGTMEWSKFQRKLKNDGFRTMSNCLFVKYCQNLDDSIKHRKRVEKIIYKKSKVSVIFVGDKQTPHVTWKK